VTRLRPDAGTIPQHPASNWANYNGRSGKEAPREDQILVLSDSGNLNRHSGSDC
jgi:hypothetical protein